MENIIAWLKNSARDVTKRKPGQADTMPACSANGGVQIVVTFTGFSNERLTPTGGYYAVFTTADCKAQVFAYRTPAGVPSTYVASINALGIQDSSSVLSGINFRANAGGFHPWGFYSAWLNNEFDRIQVGRPDLESEPVFLFVEVRSSDKAAQQRISPTGAISHMIAWLPVPEVCAASTAVLCFAGAGGCFLRDHHFQLPERQQTHAV